MGIMSQIIPVPSVPASGIIQKSSVFLRFLAVAWCACFASYPNRTLSTVLVCEAASVVNGVGQAGTGGDFLVEQVEYGANGVQKIASEATHSQMANDGPKKSMKAERRHWLSVNSGQARSKQQQRRQPSPSVSINQHRSMQEEKTTLPIRSYTYGNIHQTAYYFADVIVGTPAKQRQSLILDTGSSVLAFPCTSCKSCGRHMDPPFDCSSSSTCQSLPCSSTCTHCDAKQKRCAYRVSYMEGSSLQGFWHEDRFRLLAQPRTVIRNNQSFYDIKSQLVQAQRHPHSTDESGPSLFLTPPIKTNFGCHVQETELFVDQKASGIWGLEIWSQFGPDTYMTRTLLNSNKSSAVAPSTLPEGMSSFALCLAEHGGAFSIGDANGELHTSDTVTSNFIPHQESYSVYLSGITVGDKHIALAINNDNGSDTSNVPQTLRGSALQSTSPARDDRPNPPHHIPHSSSKFEVLLDSGTTMSYFPTRIYEELVNAIEEFAELKSGRRAANRRRLSGADVNAGKTIKPSGTTSAARGKLVRLLDLEESSSYSAAFPSSSLSGERATPARGLAAEGRSDDEWLLTDEGFPESVVGESAEQDDVIMNAADKTAVQAGTAELSGTVNVTEGVRRAIPGETSISNPQRRRQERPDPSLAKSKTAGEGPQHVLDHSGSPSERGTKPAHHGAHSTSVRDRIQQRREARRVELGREVKDSEAEVIGKVITSLSVDDEVAYELLPPSASPRQSQAVKVESTAGELCFYLPKGRADLSYFPDIWLHFVPPTQGVGVANLSQGDGPAAQGAGGSSNAPENTKQPASGWVRWQPASYLYTKGNEHYRCVAMSDDPRADSSGVLGSSFFIGHDLIFDVRNEMIGIAEARCPGIKLKDRPKELPL